MRTIAAIVLTFFAAAAWAQPTLSSLIGRVTSNAAGLAGVEVTVNSPALQGHRITVTGSDGQYAMWALPPGDYLVTFTAAGMQQVVTRAPLRLSETTRVDADLRPQSLREEITVRAADATVLATPQISTNLLASVLDDLPTGRAITDFAKLSAGVTEIGRQNLVAVSGSQPYENLYMVNGVTITDREANQPHSLYIEDAIQEATVLTSAISAEYGRFTGGVVNIITKSGGNSLSGSLRDTISSDAWREKTVFPGKLDHVDDIDHEYQGTIGGPAIRDRLWFFGAVRYYTRGSSRQTLLSSLPYVSATGERRHELKLTGNLSSNQSLVASHLDVNRDDDNVIAAADYRAMPSHRRATSLTALRYTGVLAQNLVVEGQWSAKRGALQVLGQDPTIDDSFIGGSVIWDLNGVGGHLWSPPVCTVCPATYGNGRELLVKATQFVPTRRLGTHELLAGADQYQELGRSVAHPTSSGFSTYAAFRRFGDDVYPQFIPGVSFVEYSVPPGGQRSNFRTRSAFVNDRVALGSRFTASIGLRYDENNGRDVDGRDIVKDSRLSPRIGLTYDLTGDGATRLAASFSRYASKALETAFEGAAETLAPATYTWTYDGPGINTDPTQLVPTQEAMRQLETWFLARGGLANLSDAFVTPGFVYQIGDRLQSPAIDEYTVSAGRQFGSAGLLQLHYVQRTAFDFYTLHVNLSSRVGNQLPTIVDNDDTGLSRKYRAVSLQGRWRHRRFHVAGNYTWSKLRGNVEQENVGRPAPEISAVDFYPEVSAYPQFQPTGYLNGDMRHVANLWAGYDFSTERTRVNLSVLQRFHSPRNYNARATITMRNAVTNPGYPVLVPLPYYFAPRGELRLANITSTGIALNAARRFARMEIFTQLDVTNVFSEDGVENPAGVDTTVFTNVRDRNLALFNPMTTPPIECPPGVPSSSAQCRGKAHYRVNATFGKPVSPLAYQAPRTYNVAVGARF